uniref:Uncharacterized protein n=1 Tax=Pithovirus LCPAC001 TaxID=2506585 RepID=A0A481Z4J7_9VIRU|nr:MAG: hypothetical protein LCPAC001_00800 [Pithovirus LCPAC001]
MCNSIESAQNIISTHLQSNKDMGVGELVHSSMNSNNNYTYIGKRDDCNKDSSSFSGYVIEKIKLGRLIK